MIWGYTVRFLVVALLLSCCVAGVNSQVIVGGRVPANATELTSEAEFAVAQLNTEADVQNTPLKLDHVVSAEKQTVAGTNYFMQIAVVDCTNASLEYDVTVYSPLPVGGNAQPFQLTNYSAASSDPSSPSPTDGSIAGGISSAPTANGDFIQDAQLVVNQLNKLDGILNKPLRMSSILSVQTQVVAGTNVFLQLEVLDSTNLTFAVNATVYHPLPYTGLPASVTSYQLTASAYYDNFPQDVPRGSTPANASQFIDEAEFAVSQLNNQQNVSNKPLQLDRVLSAKILVDTGINVFLDILVKNSASSSDRYNVTLFENFPSSSANRSMEMRSYALVQPADSSASGLSFIAVQAAAMLWAILMLAASL